MDFGRIFRKERRNELDDISKIKQEFEKEDKVFEKELPTRYSMLQEFKINDLKELCMKTTGQELPVEYYNDLNADRKEITPEKEDYVQFLVEELALSEIISYASKKKIMSNEALKKFKPQH